MRTAAESYQRLDSLPEFFTPADLTTVFPISRATLYRMAERGRLPCVRLGRRVIISRDHLKLWIEQEIETAAEHNRRGVA